LFGSLAGLYELARDWPYRSGEALYLAPGLESLARN